jgi:tRNA splicing ligase
MASEPGDDEDYSSCLELFGEIESVHNANQLIEEFKEIVHSISPTDPNRSMYLDTLSAALRFQYDWTSSSRLN